MAATTVVFTAPTTLNVIVGATSGNLGFALNALPIGIVTVTLTSPDSGAVFAGAASGTGSCTLTFTTINGTTVQNVTYTPSVAGVAGIVVTNGSALTNPTTCVLTCPSGTGTYAPVIPTAVGPNSRASVVTWLDADNPNTSLGALQGYTISAPGSGNGSPTCTVAAPVGGGTTALFTPVVSAGQIVGFTSSNNGGTGYTSSDNPVTVTFSGASGSPAAVMNLTPQNQNTCWGWNSNVGATPSQFVQTTAANLPVFSKFAGPSGNSCFGFGPEFFQCVKTDTALSPVLAAASSYSITIVFNAAANFLLNARFFSQTNTFVDVAANLAYNSGLKRYSGGPVISTLMEADVQNAGTLLTQGRWQVLTYTYNTSTANETLYLNGQIGGRVNGQANRESWGSLSAYFLAGAAGGWLCSQFIVDNVELTQAQILQDMVYWKTRFQGSTTPSEVVFNGDSRSAGTQSTTTPAIHTIYTYPFQVQQLYTNQIQGIANVWNMGIGGSKADTGYSLSYRASPSGPNLDNFMQAYNPLYKQVAVIWYGYNSNGLGGDSTIGGFSAAWPSLFALVKAWQDLGVPVVICTETDEQNGAATWTTFRTNYNNFIINNLGEVAGQSYLARLDLNASVGPQNASQVRTVYGYDGIHMLGDNQAVTANPSGGYSAVANVVGPKLLLALESILGTITPKPQGIGRISNNNLTAN